MLTLKTLIFSMVVLASIDHQALSPGGGIDDDLLLSPREKAFIVNQYAERTTECIAKEVSVARAKGSKEPLGDLITDSFTPCADVVRTMLDKYDIYYGDGAGEKFFDGPYLDNLPQMVGRAIEIH